MKRQTKVEAVIPSASGDIATDVSESGIRLKQKLSLKERLRIMCSIIMRGETGCTIIDPSPQLQIDTSRPNDAEDDAPYRELEKNLFISSDEEYKVRLIKSIGKERNYDQLVVATSKPHLLEEADFAIMQAMIPDLMSVDPQSSHEILLTKSPASSFEELQDKILVYIFRKLEDNYDWLNQPQIVKIVRVLNPDILVFHLRVPTKRHLSLGRALYGIRGIERLSADSFPLCMDHDNNFQFSLQKGKAFTWDELYPAIEDVFVNHFQTGVIFDWIEEE